MQRLRPAFLSLMVTVLFSATGYSQMARLDNVDYEDLNCEAKDFSCPKEQLAVADHHSGRYSAGEKWLRENAALVETEIDAIRKLSVELILADQPQTIKNLKYRIELAKQKIDEIADPIRKLLRELEVKMAHNETDEEYMRFYRYCFKLGNENYMRYYDICGMQKLGDKLYQMSVQENGHKFHAQAMYYLDMLHKYQNYDKYIESRLAPFRDINDRLMGISYKSVIGTPTFWLDQLAGPFSRYALSVNRYLQVFENIEIKKAEMRDRKTRSARIAQEISQFTAHYKQHQTMLASIDEQIKGLQEEIASHRSENLKSMERLGSLYNTTTPKNSMAFISSQSIPYGQDRLIKVDSKAFKVPANTKFIQISANRRVLYKSNGFWRRNRIDYPELLGEVATTKGYIGAYLKHKDIPLPSAQVGALLASFSSGQKMEVGASGPVPIGNGLRGQTFGLMINDFQPGLSRGDCPNPLGADKRCFSLVGGETTFTAKYFADTDETFPKILAYLKSNLDRIVANNVNTSDPFNKVREEVLEGIRDYTDDIGPFLPIVNRALSIKLMEKKIHDLELNMHSMFADRNVIQSRVESAKQSISSLEKALEAAEQDVEKIEAIVNNYFERKLVLERANLYTSLREFSDDLNLYVDSLIYREPSDKESFKKFLEVQQMVSAFLASSRMYEHSDGLAGATAESIRLSLCEPFVKVASQVNGLCKEFNEEIKLEEIKQAISRFFVGQDRKWRFPKIYGDRDLLHCEIHLGATSGRGKRYLKSQFGVDYIQRLIFDENGRSEFYIAKDFDSPQFNLDNACSFVSPNLRSECRKSKENAAYYLEDLQGYYELPFQTINGLTDPKANNMDCNFTSEQLVGISNPLMLGAAIEWRANEGDELSNGHVSSAVIQKSSSSWFDYRDASDDRVKTTYSKIADLPSKHSNHLERAVRLMSSRYMQNGSKEGSSCGALDSPLCALKMLGRSIVKPVENDVYNFKTSFANSWFHNDWVLRIPIYSGKGMKAYNRYMLEELVDLKLHFYFIGKTEGER